MKQTYEAPKLEKLGSFEGLTMSTASGVTTDAAFPAQAPLITGALS